MDKPKELTGKAVPFIEWLTKIYVYEENMHYVDIVAKFYSQPFTPELLNLFKGWKIEIKEDVVHYVSGTAIIADLPEQRKKRGLLYYNIDTENGKSFYFPETLNDFISDCKRSKIELEWK